MFLKDKPHSKYLTRAWNGLSVSYAPDLDGGGLVFADDYIAMMNALQDNPPVGRIYEWCCGPGFIGYALLAHGFGTSLCLADIHPPAVEAARATAQANKIEDKVDVYLGDGLDALPAHETFDLVVGNPPQFQNRIMLEHVFRDDPKIAPRIYVDPEWRFHKAFFARIRDHLNRNGRIILTECSGGAHVETFRPMIEAHGLVLSGWQWPHTRRPDMFYLFVSRDDATEPFRIPETQPWSPPSAA